MATPLASSIIAITLDVTTRSDTAGKKSYHFSLCLYNKYTESMSYFSGLFHNSLDLQLRKSVGIAGYCKLTNVKRYLEYSDRVVTAFLCLVPLSYISKYP